jgi:hypothetical protein
MARRLGLDGPFSPGGQVERFRQGFEWTSLGKIHKLVYPCRSAGGAAPWSCLGSETERTLTHDYSLGRLASIQGVLDSVTYHPNGLLDLQSWTGGGSLHQTLDSSMPRPATLGVPGLADPWLHYKYDGAGNVLQELDEGWAYDGAGRVVYADYGVLGVGSFAYDGFGNRTSWTPPGGAAIPEPTSTSTNRLNGAGVLYDARGNLVDTGSSPNDPVFGWDPLNTLMSVFTGGLEQR